MNQSSNKLYSVQSIPSLFKGYFEYEIDFFDMLKVVSYVKRHCGDNSSKLFLFKGRIEDFKLTLPCNVKKIEYVVSSNQNYFYNPYFISDCDVLINYRVDQTGNIGAFNPTATDSENINEEDINLYEVNENIFYAPFTGMIDYQNDDNCCLSFNNKQMDIDVLYWGEILDEQGYPMVTEKVIDAIAYYYHYVKIRRKFNSAQVSGDVLQLAKDEAERRIANARTPESMNIQENNEMLNGLTTFNRKKHNLPFRKF